MQVAEKVKLTKSGWTIDVRRAPFEYEAMQHPAECEAFLKLIARDPPTSYLEIGAKFGGMVWQVASVMKPGSRIVAVDLPEGTIRWSESEPSLRSCMERLRDLGHDAHILWGDSTDASIIERARALGPFDLVFVDANHTERYVRKDWANYGRLGKVVAFHDIAWWREKCDPRMRIEVPEFWLSVRDQYASAEIKMDPTKQDNGIGVLWRRSATI